jgi:hypothetical protein
MACHVVSDALKNMKVGKPHSANVIKAMENTIKLKRSRPHGTEAVYSILVAVSGRFYPLNMRRHSTFEMINKMKTLSN